MSNNIVTSIDYTVLTQQQYRTDDILLIQSTQIATEFNPEIDNIEVFVYDLNNQIVATDYNFINYQTYQDSTNTIGSQFVLNNIKIDPVADLESYFFDSGEYIINYNFYRGFFGSSVDTPFFIKEISPSRTELRLDTNYLTNDQLVSASFEFSSSRFGRQFDDFYLNLGNNNVIIANNFLLDTTTEDYSVLVKLYEPLPERFGLKSQTWIVDKISDPSSFQVEFIFEPIVLTNEFQLQGPNLNLNFKDQINNSDAFQTYNTILSTSLTSSQQQYLSLLQEKAININIDFSNFNNFIHFSSAEARLNNFFYKVQEIENYTSDLNSLSTLANNSQVSSSKGIIEANINNIIENFDEYEYYLYYDSSSYSWPKSTSTKPYILYSTTSSQVLTWFGSAIPTSPYYGGQILSASNFDEDNQNYLYYSTPEYLRNDPSNESYMLFIDMIGQLFDNIWVYYKDVTNKYDADNRLDFGVSKDLIAEVIRDLGVKIYQNNFSNQDVFSAFLGINPQGGLFPSTGSELITNYVTSSNEMIPLDDIEKSIYKRIYHNIPYLLKTKGTVTGLQTIVSLYGVPDTILRVSEFGGKDKNNSNDWDYWQHKFNYKYDTLASGFVSSSWPLNTDWASEDNVPSTLEFRFKAPTSGSTGAVKYAVSNSLSALWSLNTSAGVVLEYTGSGFATASYSGSTVDQYYQYGTLKFIPDNSTSASLYFPFFNGDWWSVMVTRTNDTFSLQIANNIYDGDDGSSIGYNGSAVLTGIDATNWITATASYFGSPTTAVTLAGTTYKRFSGSYQEIRYYNTGLSQSNFWDYAMNPDSIEGNSLNSAPSTLAFRASLGGELETGSISIHPKVTGSWVATSSFASNSSFHTGSGRFSTNKEYIFLDQPAVGIQNIVSNKIQILPTILAPGNTSGNQTTVGVNMLSPYRSIQIQNNPYTGSYTNNVNYTEIAFSPQNEINEDIMDSLGYFNIGDYIGDPRQRFNQDVSYPALDKLRNEYFEKYESNYDFNDYINLIKYFDNSLFKMLQDFTPARTSLASGVVIKQNLLERNKYPLPETTSSLNDFSGSILMGTIEGGAGGSVNKYNSLDTNPYYLANGLSNNYGLTQSWSESIVTPYGLDNVIHSSQDEFYNGEYSGSEYIVTNGELNEANPFKQVPTTPTNYTLDLWGSEFGTSENTFLNTVIPSAGTASFWSQDANASIPIGSPSPYIQWAKIHSIDLQGNNNSLSLEALETLVTNDTNLRGPFIITSISPRNSGEYYVLEFAPGNAAYTFPGPPVGNVTRPNRQVVFSPYVTSETGPFYNSDYNAIINNAIFNRSSEWYQQVDYATAQTLPVNFQQLISGTAAPASVQDSNYTSYQFSGIRYWGSKNTTDNFNSPLTITSSIVQTYQNDNLGLTTLGYPSIQIQNCLIAEFSTGGGTSLEIMNKYATFLGNLYQVGTATGDPLIDRDNITIIRPIENFYYQSVELWAGVREQMQIIQYSSTAKLPQPSTVFAVLDYLTPASSDFCIFSNFTGSRAIVQNSLFQIALFDNSGECAKTISNNITGSAVSASSLATSISSSLADGNRMFISVYNPRTLNSLTYGSQQQTIVPLPIEIDSIGVAFPGGEPLINLKEFLPTSTIIDSFGSGSGFSAANNEYGMLIFTAGTGTSIIFDLPTGNSATGIGKGAIIEKFNNRTINEQFNYITRTFGENTVT